jgi:RNA polymerase sigma factor (sigma-70 family)
VDLVRAEMRRNRATGRPPEMLPLCDQHADIPCPLPGPEAIAIKRQMARQVVQAFSELPRRLQDVLRLSYETEATHTEIAAMWGLERSRISHLHAEAIALLRDQLAPELAAPAPTVEELFAPDIVRGATPDLLNQPRG